MSDKRSLLEEYVRNSTLMQLATLRPDGAPAVCNVWYDPHFTPDILRFISRHDRRHSDDVRHDKRVAGSIVAVPLEGLGQVARHRYESTVPLIEEQSEGQADVEQEVHPGDPAPVQGGGSDGHQQSGAGFARGLVVAVRGRDGPESSAHHDHQYCDDQNDRHERADNGLELRRPAYPVQVRVHAGGEHTNGRNGGCSYYGGHAAQVRAAGRAQAERQSS